MVGDALDYRNNSEELTEAVKVRLFGREYSIRGHGNKRYIETLADFIKERADEIESQRDCGINTGFGNLDTVEHHRRDVPNKQVKEQTIRELEEKTERLLKAIDRVV